MRMESFGQRLNGMKWLSLSISGLVFSILLGWFVLVPRLELFFLVRAGEEQSATLRLAVDGMRSTLERYAPIPDLIAARPEIELLFNNPDSVIFQENARQLLSETAIALRTSGVYLEDLSGRTLIAVPSEPGSNVDAAENLTYRPYFRQAVAGGLGQYYALGTESGERGFFYASPVRKQSRIDGVVVIKFSVGQFEAAWREGSSEIIVRDANDIIFMSSRPDWNIRTMVPLTEAQKKLITSARQYPVKQLTLLNNAVTPLNNKYSIIEIEDGDEKQSYISTTSLIARPGWRVSILTPTTNAIASARAVFLIILSVVLLAVMFIYVLIQRMARQKERTMAQKQAQEMLERRVQERTAELNTANTLLVGEVEERKAAEEKLRRTQKDLVQAGKLAALGQMSAAISHELNQPLTAIKAYAGNTSEYIERDIMDKAKDNIRQISSLADRMSSITKHLRNFARRPQDKTKVVSLIDIVDDAIAVMKPQITSVNASLNIERSEEPVFVYGGQIRLQQVVVNLISNALDAMTDLKEPKIDISIINQGREVHLTVRDYGSGLDSDAMKYLFDPFYTTKDPGKGLGLGLSISYNIIRDFDGNLSAANHEDGGAIFRISLIAAANATTKEDVR